MLFKRPRRHNWFTGNCGYCLHVADRNLTMCANYKTTNCFYLTEDRVINWHKNRIERPTLSEIVGKHILKKFKTDKELLNYLSQQHPCMQHNIMSALSKERREELSKYNEWKVIMDGLFPYLLGNNSTDYIKKHMNI